MTTEKICILIAIVVYLLGVLGIGIWCAKRSNTVDDFYLGGRKLGPLVTAMSAEASDMSGWLLMGLPGVAYLTGVADAAWTAIGLAIGTYVNWLIVAKRIRRYTHVAGNSITLPDFFSRRFHDDKNVLMCIAAVIIIVFFIPYTASGFAACGKLFSSLFGIHYVTAMVICAIVILGYTTLGGFLAASTTDFIQSIVMSIALLIVLGFSVGMAGGMDAVMENAREIPGYLGLTSIHVPETNSAAPYGALNIASMLAWGLGYFGMPHVLLRFMAIDDAKKLSLSRRVATVWVVISLAVAVMIGIIGNGMSKAGVIETLSDPETIIVRISDLLSRFGVVPALIAGVILAGILASTMSTADSQLLAAASAVSHNMFRGVFRMELSEKAAMLVARISVIVISVICIATTLPCNAL